ncbi:hypothetical protein BH23VER1_BH23VER1_10280 [soil metagenome]
MSPLTSAATTGLLFAVVGFLSFAVPQAAPAALLLHYSFDESASGSLPALDGGAAPPAPGTFVGAAERTGNTPGGFSVGALDIDQPNSFVTAGDVDKLDGLSQLTLAGWLNLQAAPGHGNRIMSKQDATSFGGFSFALNNPTEGAAERRADNFQLNMALGGDGGFTFNTSGADLDADNTWIFVAVTYDGTTAANNLKFYWGDPLTPVAQLGADLSSTSGQLPSLTQEFKVGAQSEGTVSPPAWFDDIRVYDEVLDLEALDGIRLANVPEPGALALLAIGGALCLARRRSV